jgi:hypothetical protein
VEGRKVGRAWHGGDPPHGAAAIGTDGEIGGGDRAIGFGAFGDGLASVISIAGIEQPTTAGEVVAAGAIGEEAIVADAMEAVRQGVQRGCL